MIKIFLIIYFVGYVCAYFSYRACEKHYSKKWTKRQRLTCLSFSFFSWIICIVAFLYFITEIFLKKNDLDEPTKW